MTNDNIRGNEARSTGILMNATTDMTTVQARYVDQDGTLLTHAEYLDWLESRRYA